MKRIILTYNQSCNLTCDFCYVNFHHQKIEDKTYEVVKRAISLDFDVITFGGGDSFSKSSFRKSCILAKENGLFTQVDTNGISITQSDFSFIENFVDLIGISLDGVGETHNYMRKSKNLFTKVNSVLQTLKESNTRIKINTILTKQNRDSIYDIFRYLMQFENIYSWSIYQFFPLSAARKKKDTFEICDDDFDSALTFLDKEEKKFKIEKFKYSDRVSGYIFCDEQGKIYTNSLEGDYRDICSIFDFDVAEKLSKLDECINPKTINRYIN
ncbi:radical SAM protein [Bacillus sp. EB600]|uniref:radical SAM protein n=1 Tax=Bacillus sp. EB600 TaxID=2806345 RepID=UPI00210BD9F2|nr:radical SAM protein [Bacillus sp. EB600]MCQ6280060.1 radical SAM protein [Bacillus sp. EB600]